LKTGHDETPDLVDFVSDDFIVGVTTLVSRTANLYSARIRIYVLMMGLAQFLWGLLGNLLFFSSSPFVRPFYTPVMGTDLFALLTSAMNLIGFSSSLIVLNLVFYSMGVVVFAIFGGGAIKYTLDIYRNHSKGSVKKSFSFAKTRAVTLIRIQLIIGSSILLIVSPIIIALIQGMIVLYPISPYSLLSVLGSYIPLLLICLSGVVYVSVRLTIAPVIAIAEDLNALDSLRRSWELTRGNSTHTFKGILLLMILLGVLTGTLSFFALVLFFGVSVWMTIIPAAINQLFLGPIFSVFMVILYMNLLAIKQSKNSNWWNKPTKGMDAKEIEPRIDDAD